MQPGERNRKVIFQRTGPPTDDGYTMQPGAWEAYCIEWASVSFGTGQERREAAQESASASATFQVLRNSKTAALSVTDRIVFDGSTWDIISVVPSREFNAGVDITAVRALA
jgi:head-tail adaptor